VNRAVFIHLAINPIGAVKGLQRQYI
jgi:hypothetical protein